MPLYPSAPQTLFVNNLEGKKTRK